MELSEFREHVTKISYGKRLRDAHYIYLEDIEAFVM